MSGKKKMSKVKKPLMLPKNIRYELCLTCALRGYSEIKSGGGKKMTAQYAEMGKFYHGKEPTHPSQIDFLSKAALPYSLLYEKNMLTLQTKKTT